LLRIDLFTQAIDVQLNTCNAESRGRPSHSPTLSSVRPSRRRDTIFCSRMTSRSPYSRCPDPERCDGDNNPISS
jgi:hypothetical protein